MVSSAWKAILLLGSAAPDIQGLGQLPKTLQVTLGIRDQNTWKAGKMPPASLKGDERAQVLAAFTQTPLEELA